MLAGQGTHCEAISFEVISTREYEDSDRIHPMAYQFRVFKGGSISIEGQGANYTVRGETIKSQQMHGIGVLSYDFDLDAFRAMELGYITKYHPRYHGGERKICLTRIEYKYIISEGPGLNTSMKLTYSA